MNDRLLIVGPGRVGLALGGALWEAGALDALTFAGRRPEPPSHPRFLDGDWSYVYGIAAPRTGTTGVLLSVPDDVVPGMAELLARAGDPPEGCVAMHLSGTLPLDPLTPLHERGYSVGSLHPLQAIAHPLSGAERLPGSSFAVAGEPGAMALARRLLVALGSPALAIPVSQRILYHVAAVTASNYVTTLLGTAIRLLVRAGASEEEATRALVHLARGSVENVGEVGPREALTGPVARGDLETVRLHLRTLDPEDRELYRTLGRETLKWVRDPDPAVADELKSLLETAP